MTGNRLAVFSFLTFFAAVSSAIEFEVNVQSGDTPLRNAPVRVPVDFGSGVPTAVSLSGDGFIGMGQITPASVAAEDGTKSELCFVIPHLPANEKLTIIGKTVNDEEVKNGFAFDSQEHETTMSVGGRNILRCMREPIDRSSPERIGETYKVFHHVFDPSGSRYVTKGPGGLFPHHRGLFFGFNKISYGDNQQADIWHCRNGEHQEHKSEELTMGAVLGRDKSEIAWHGRDDKVFAHETRELTSYNLEGGVLIEFASLLQSKVGKIELKGDPQHAGFQFRASQEVPDKTKAMTYYLRPDGKGEPGKFRNWSNKEDETQENLDHINLPWNALCFVLDGKKYTCCYLDHPNNPKEARYSERDYGRFGSYFEYELDNDKPLKLNYRIWLQEGEMSVEEVNELSKSFVSPPKVTASAALAKAEAKPDREGFTSIFDGKSLDGWDGDPKFWTVKEGAITGTTTKEVAIKNGNTFIIWDGDTADFELKLQYKIVGHPKGNSGIQYRSFRLDDKNDNKWRVGGYQADFETGERYSGICYGEGFRGILSDRGDVTRLTTVDGKVKKEVIGSVGDAKEIGSKIKSEEWNDYHIIARGNHFVHKINGVTTMELTDDDEQARADGLLALQLHAGPPMEVQFKNIRIKHLSDTKVAGKDAKKKVVFVAGTRSHGYGSHEHNAGCLLLAKALKKAMPNFDCDVHQNGWPHNGVEAFEGADAVVVYCDGGGRHLLNPHIDEFREVMDKGVGLACIHYGVEVPKGKSGDAFLDWTGGYFETNWSVNPHWTAEFKDLPDHPVSNGVKPFAINDEWYFHMRFRDEMKGVTPILSAVAPESTMSRSDGAHSGNPHVRKAVATGKPQHVAWVSENESGGRGFGFTGGHFHWNWGDDNFRKVALNAICWVAKAEVPADGIGSETPSRIDLEANQDFPKPKPKKALNKKQRKAAGLLKTSKSNKRHRTIPVALKSENTDGSHDPKQAVANMDVHPELKAQLFAAEPLMLSPSGIDIDHRGRIWVCEVVNYRDFANRNNPVRQAGDRILILEDTDGDGAADKKTVFYQGRDIDSPHGICVLGNRVIVSANGKVFNFYDDDGDDNPDRKEVMYSGISGENHDHGIHAFQFGPDGKLYFNFGNAGKQLLTPDGKEVVDQAGNVINDKRKPYQQGMVFRQNLDDSGIETLGWNFRNNWMVTVDSFGTIWQSDNDDDGNRGVRINYVMEFGNYGYTDEFTGAGWRTERTNMSELPAKHWHQRDPGVVPNMLHTGAGSPTGIMIYEGEMLPESLRGQLIHCDAGPSVTRAYVTSEDGAGYSAEIVNILEGTRDKWFRPSDVKAAPDGSIVVADWYDPGVGGHRMGDPERGRLFRVIPKSHGGDYTVPKHDFETAAGAVKALRSPNNSVRYMAWTALHKMGEKAEPELLKLWEDNNHRMRARALWLLGKIPGKGRKYVDVASRDANKNIRCAAIRLARQLDDVEVLPVVERLVGDPSSAVRRECAIALRHNKTEAAAELWARLAKQHDGKDRWYLEALGIAADKQWDRFMASWLDSVDGKWNTPGGQDLVWRSRAKATSKWLAAVLDDKSVTEEQLPRYFRSMDFLSASGRDEIATKFAFAKASADDARAKMISAESLRRLSASALAGKPEYKSALAQTLNDMKGTKGFVDLVSKFNVSERYPELLEQAQSDPEGQIGVESIRALLSKGNTSLIKQALSSEKLDTVNNTVTALGSAADNRCSDLLAGIVNAKSQDIEVRRNAVRAIAKSRQGASRLLRGVENGRLDPALKSIAAASLNRVRWGDIRDKAKSLLPVPASKGAEKLPNLGDLARMRGDAGNGAKVFAGAGTCAKCHIVNEQGKEVGPNLSEIGTKLSREAMFESILYPSAGISHNYEAYNLLDSDGNQVTGLLTSSTDAEVVITSDDGIARTYKRDDIEVLEKQKISLMPADLQTLMSKQELIDVVEYLTTLKKK